MRFASPIALILAGAALAAARGLPRANEMLDVDGGVLRRANCETYPSARRTPSSPQPVGAPAAATAAECQARCAAAASAAAAEGAEGEGCQSFVFGATGGAGDGGGGEDGVECLLYGVAVSEIPEQTYDDLKAYDRACTQVPAEL